MKWLNPSREAQFFEVLPFFSQARQRVIHKKLALP
jgi:hypothetical protein